MGHAGDGASIGLDCVLIADDLTGACDAAAAFAVAGYRTTACLHPAPDNDFAEILAISTDTRETDPSTAECTVSEAARALSGYSPSILFKKIDSTLRGNVKEEIAAVLSAFACDAAIICPAFPKLHRIVVDGKLYIHGTLDKPIEILDRLRDLRLEPCVSARAEEIGEAISRGARMVLVDASSDDELDELVARTKTLKRLILWVGSGGLASAVARTLASKNGGRLSEPPRRGPLAFCIGSDHAVTAAQQDYFYARHSVLTVPPIGIDPRELATALDQGRHVWIQIPRNPDYSKELGRLLRPISPAAMLLSGGYTASLVCRAAGALTIDIRDEILPGIPYGVIRGGDCDGRIVVTKSGAFGSADALSRIADFFS